MDSKRMWTFMIQLGNNMWDKKNRQTSYIKDEEESIYRDYLYLDKPLWNEITAFLPSCGFNTILIDIGEGIRLDSHPELAVEGSWTKEEMRAELARLRSLGLEPIPKYNFSCGHSAWLQDYAYMVGTPTYDRVCKDIIEEVIELFDEFNKKLYDFFSVFFILTSKVRPLVGDGHMDCVDMYVFFLDDIVSLVVNFKILWDI